MLKGISESEIINGMHGNLVKEASNQDFDNVEQAVDYLNNAIDIFESEGLNSQADQVLNVLYKIAQRHKPKKPKKPHTISDRHTKGLTSEKMLKNLKSHGTEFNMADTPLDTLSIDFEDSLEIDDNFDWEDEK